jgi:hypothetical protein
MQYHYHYSYRGCSRGDGGSSRSSISGVVAAMHSAEKVQLVEVDIGKRGRRVRTVANGAAAIASMNASCCLTTVRGHRTLLIRLK